MRAVTTRAELRVALTARASRRIGFVPTMGSLHRGHAALFEEARRRSDLVVASIFVNPLQFGSGADLERYPRSLPEDLEACHDCGVDVVFTPDVDTVYPGGEPHVRIEPGPLNDVLEGASRPGHFAGVLTVVAKLLNLVTPHVAVFGEKDYQQLVMVRRMVSDLCMPVEVVGVPTVRDLDGLALSSRNRLLGDEERRAAAALHAALVAGQGVAVKGPAEVLRVADAALAGVPQVVVDYVALRAPNLTEPPSSGPARLLVAATVGSTRLIDNIAVALGDVARPSSIGGGP